MTTHGPPLDASVGRRVSRDTLSRQLEDALRIDIVEGVFRPGERLRAADLERRYRVSATPLREALQHLAAEGLVILDPGLGARVAPASLADLHDIYEARALIEAEALVLSIENATAAWRAELHDRMQKLQRASVAVEDGQAETDVLLAWSAAHRDFHLALFSRCRSQWLIRFIMTLYDHSERYRMLAWGREIRRDVVSEHQLIFDAAMAGETNRAREALRNHLLATVALLEQQISLDGRDASSDGA